MRNWTKCQRSASSLALLFAVILLLAFASALDGRIPRELESSPNRLADVSTVDFCDSVTEISTTECQALVDLYNATGGACHNDNFDWLMSFAPCLWYGVGCSTGHVCEIEMELNNLAGSLAQSLCNLDRLEHVQMDDNSLTGGIPTCLRNLSRGRAFPKRGGCQKRSRSS